MAFPITRSIPAPSYFVRRRPPRAFFPSPSEVTPFSGCACLVIVSLGLRGVGISLLRRFTIGGYPTFQPPTSYIRSCCSCMSMLLFHLVQFTSTPWLFQLNKSLHAVLCWLCHLCPLRMRNDYFGDWLCMARGLCPLPIILTFVLEPLY
jgi:hypothetical protein